MNLITHDGLVAIGLDNQKLFDQVNTCSVDLTIASKYKYMSMNDREFIYGQNDGDYWWEDGKVIDGYINIDPGDCILACTNETINMPDCYCGQIYTKSSLGRVFVNHMMAGFVDAGFSGKITLELVNEGLRTVKIPVGARVVQMVIMELDDRPILTYAENRTSRYNNATGLEYSKAEK